MAMKLLAQHGTRLARLAALGWLVIMPGCCGNLLVSQRFGDQVCGEALAGDSSTSRCGKGGCTDGACSHGEDEDATIECSPPGIPVLVWPNWLSCRPFFHAHHKLQGEIGEMLQPGPPPPVKPPHSRFHPIPTQPVFAQRATYTPPELAGITPEQLQLLKEGGAQHAAPEDVLTPVPEAVELKQPRVPEPPMPAPEPAPRLVPPPPAARPPMFLPPDPSKGPVDPVIFKWNEPNPLRPSIKGR